MSFQRFYFILSLVVLLTVPAASGARIGARNPAPAFRVEQVNGRVWLVDPAGSRFFSVGVCCVTPGTAWADYDPAKPAYAAWQHYRSQGEWAGATRRRLKTWGFTTIGGWSDYAALRQSGPMDSYFTLVLHAGSSAGAPWWDMWDPKVLGVMDTVVRTQVLKVRDDPKLLGYYTDNEMGWWNATLFKMTLEQKPTSGQRLRLITLLRRRYHNSWTSLMADFDPVRAASFRQLASAGMLYVRPGGQGVLAVRGFVGLLAQRYYSIVRETIRKYDRRALILGDRYQSFYFPEVARAAGPYVDVVSSNVNATWLDGTVARYYLSTLHTLTGRPIMVGEYYMCAAQNRSGNRNDSSGFPTVATQDDRAAGFRNTLASFCNTPYILGADWFQYYDEPQFGRGDGENYNMGLVDINDRPYESLVDSVRAVSPQQRHGADHAVRATAADGVPPAPADPVANMKVFSALMGWDRERGFVPASSPAPMGDLYLCWKPDAVYVGVLAMDIVEAAYYKNGKIPDQDRPLLNIAIGGRRTSIRLGAARTPESSDPRITVTGLSGLQHDARNIAVLRIPAALFGKQSLSAGDSISMDVALTSFARAHKDTWPCRFTLSQ